MARTVFCEYEHRDTDGLDYAPWPGALGQRVFAGIGKTAWAAWLAHQTMLINENRLSPMNPEHRAFLQVEMEKFLFGGGAEKPAGYVPDGDMPDGDVPDGDVPDGGIDAGPEPAGNAST